MSWNYRIMRHEVDGEVWYGVHEVYYDVNGEPRLWTEKPETIEHNTAKDVIETLTLRLS